MASQLTVMLWGEPKLRTLVWHSVKVEEMTDDAGRAIGHKPYARAQPFHRGQSFLMLALHERTLPRRFGRLRITSKVLAAAT